MRLLRKLDFSGNPYLGVYGMACDAGALLAPDVPAKACKEIARALEVEVVQSTLGASTVIGALIAANSHGAIVSDLASDHELATIRRFRPRRLDHRLNAMGNNVLANDHGAVVNPEYDAAALRAIAAALGVSAERGTVAGVNTVGSAAAANNRGALCHPHVTDEERALVERILRVPVSTSTANFGTPQVGACLLSNSHGAVVGTRTTGIELGRISEGLDLL